MVEASDSKRPPRRRAASVSPETDRQEAQGERFLRESQLIAGPAPIVPISRSTLWRWVRVGSFPKPVKLSAQVTAWRSSEVERWLAQAGARA